MVLEVDNKPIPGKGDSQHDVTRFIFLRQKVRDQ